MSAFLYGITLQWKLDLRNKGILLIYYVVPLIFFGFMGGIFTSINPEAYQTLIPSMTIFGVTMGAILGAPIPLIEVLGSNIKKAYRVGGIPLWTTIINNFISGLIHLLIMSLVIYLVAPIAFDATLPKNAGVYWVNVVMLIITCLAIATVLGVLVKTEGKLTMIGQLIFLPSIMLSGIMFPVEMLPEFLITLGKIFPATWGYQNMCGEVFEIGGVIPLVLIIVVCIAITVWKMKGIFKE